MAKPPGEGPSDVVSDELLKRLKPRQDAELYRRDLKNLVGVLDTIQERRRTAAALEMLEVSDILDKLNLIISNQEQATFPRTLDLEKDYVSYLDLLKRIYEHCTTKGSDTHETKSAKADRRNKTFDLYVRVLELMLTYTHLPLTRSKEKLAAILNTSAIRELIPPDLIGQIEDELFAQESKVRPIK